MPNVDDQFVRLMAEVRAGSDEAFCKLLRQHGDRIYRTIRRRLHRKVRVQFDSQDFFQQVWLSLYANRDVFSRFKYSRQLVAFLCTVARNKVVDECRRRLIAEKRNVHRERSHDNSEITRRSNLTANVPTPSEVAIANEEWLRLISGQPEHYKRIVELRADGASYDEIAE